MTDKKLPLINLTRCDHCAKCVDMCPENALEMTAHGPAFKEPNLCTFCTTCEAVCPHGAIRAPYSVAWVS